MLLRKNINMSVCTCVFVILKYAYFTCFILIPVRARHVSCDSSLLEVYARGHLNAHKTYFYHSFYAYLCAPILHTGRKHINCALCTHSYALT